MLSTKKELQEHLKSLEGLNEFDRLVENLKKENLTIRHLEFAYREYTRRRKDIPESVVNILVGTGKTGDRGVLHFAADMLKISGGVWKAYLRGKFRCELI